MKKVLIGLSVLLCVACSEEQTSAPEKSSAPVVASSSAPAPKKVATLTEEAQSLANVLAQFEQESEQYPDKQQEKFTENMSGEEAAKVVHEEIAFIKQHIQRLKAMPLAQPPVMAIRDKLVQAYEADVQVQEQTAVFFVAAEASSPEAQAVLASEPALPEIDSELVEEEALQALGELLKTQLASAPVSASAASATP